MTVTAMPVLLLLLLSLLCLLRSGSAAVAPGGWSERSLPTVLLRMDDLAVRSCVDMARAAVDAVLAKDTPITVSVIAKDFDKPLYAEVASYVRSLASNSLVEVASHSYSHSTYTGQGLAWQKEDMSLAQAVLSGVTGVLPTSFVPPQSSFDGDTLQAVHEEERLSIFSAKCVWNKDTPGSVISCPSPGAVSVPDVYREGSYQLPAGAVLGGDSYWNNKVQPGNLTEAIKWIESQILNQNFSVVLLHPYEFSTTTECVSVDTDKIALLESLIDYGAGKWQFATFQEAIMHFNNDTTLFDLPEERDDAKFEFQARLNIGIVFVFTGCVMCVACLSFCRTSTEQKIQRKDRQAAEMKRKKDIDSKLKTQRQQRDVELTTNSKSKINDKKKINKAAYSMI
jgi:peptidoglycan/xylan/chitin deacetylase (PgdA/CDA1 family)